MLPSIHSAFQQKQWPGATGEHPRRTAERRLAMRQVLERYVTGKSLLIRRDIKEMGSDPIKAHMRGFWEFRSQGRMEETRLFGFFARAGAFVATAFKGRGEFRLQSDWNAQRNDCAIEWTRLAGSEDFKTSPFPVTLRSQLADYLDAGV